MSFTLNKYVVTNCSTEVYNEGFSLIIRLQRLSLPFWFSLFVPSVCLILAAEVALFIDDTHFEAMIMVSLTSNLVMYTMHNSIQQELPKDSSLKLIDIWLLHGLLMPMLVFITLATNELINSKTAPDQKRINTGHSVFRVSEQKDQDYVLKTNKKKTCIHICKSIIPTVSFIFMITFFIICLNK